MQPALENKNKGYLALLVTSVFWGTTWVASKIGVSGMPALQMAAIRQFLGGGILVLFFIFRTFNPALAAIMICHS